jgi:hypothetical protein
MAYQQLPGTGIWIPQWRQFSFPATLANVGTIDATGEKCAFVGRVWFKERTGTKAIRKVGFRFGTVTKAGGSGLTVSLQDIDLTAGAPMQPDGTQDQTVAIANGNAAFASNTWITTGNLSADRTVTYGDLIAVVIEFDGSGRQGADAVNITGIGASAAANTMHQGISIAYTASWAAVSTVPNVILEFSDGTFGTLDGGFPCSASNTHTFNSSSTPDEYALAFSLPFPCKVDGLRAAANFAGNDATITLYEGTTVKQSVAIDGNAIYTAAGPRMLQVPIPETTLAANTTYYVAVKADTTSNISLYSTDVDNANHFTTVEGGTPLNYVTRTDAGAWDAATTTRRLLAGVRISSLDDGTGSGGGGGFPILGGSVVR